MDDGWPQQSAADVTILDLVCIPNLLFKQFIFRNRFALPADRAGTVPPQHAANEN
jgi:hypothetical protein